MTINYKIDRNDLLLHQLFLASKSERIKKKRQRNKWGVLVVYFFFGSLFLFDHSFTLGIIFFIIGLLWFFMYPIRERKRYIKHYEDFIEENYKERFDRMVSLEFSNDFIIAKDSGSESKILTTEIV
jgi:hypothetical protein